MRKISDQIKGCASLNQVVDPNYHHCRRKKKDSLPLVLDQIILRLDWKVLFCLKLKHFLLTKFGYVNINLRLQLQASYKSNKLSVVSNDSSRPNKLSICFLLTLVHGIKYELSF